VDTETIAQAYVNCVELDDRARTQYPELAEDLSNLRADLHALLMDALRKAGIPFFDRTDAARIAFEIAQAHRKVS
jgi:hypothetical protein